jgi:serine protease Do
MRVLLILFSIIILLNVGCKRPDRTLQNRPEIEEGSSTDKDRKARNTTRNEELDSKNNRNSVINDSSDKPLKGLSDLFKELQSEVFMIYAINELEEVSQGSGFFIATDIAVTNYHVLEGSKEAIITIAGNTFKILDILAISDTEQKDYVIFRTNYKTKDPLKIAKIKPLIGEDIFAIGSPKGLTNSLTKGTISGFRDNHRIQIDATIDHGSSGGPLFNERGEVIGITTSGLGTGSELNFAVNIQALPYKKYVNN